MTYDQLIAALFPNGAPSNYRDHALILPLDAVLAMQAAQVQVGSERHKVQPVPTTDGRYFIGADILTELAEGGLFAAALPYFDGAALAGVEVMPWAEGVAMIRRPININTASADELQSLPGVGPVIAQAIIDGRDWADPADLSVIDGISADMVAGWQAAPGLVV